MIRALLLSMLLAAPPMVAHAHGLTVFASTDCSTLRVEATFSNGKAVQTGDIEVRGGDNQLLATIPVTDGTARMPLSELDYSGGLLVLIDTDGHDDYWILTSSDIARQCDN